MSESLEIKNGKDYNESQLDALFYSAHATEVAWSTGTERNKLRLLKVVILATDFTWHEAGEGFKQDIKYIQHPGVTNETTVPQCESYDYPEITAVGEALRLHEVYPLFLATENFTSSYETLLGDLKLYAGSIQVLDDDSGNVIESTLAGLADITCILNPPPLMTAWNILATSVGAMGVLGLVAAGSAAAFASYNKAPKPLALDFDEKEE